MVCTTAVLFTEVTCPQVGCHCLFAISNSVIARLRESHETFYCPFGHGQHFAQDNEVERLRGQLAAEKHRSEFLEAQRARAMQERINAEKSAQAYKGVATRIKKRILGGICPCCNRYFQNMHRHMSDKHADYATSNK